MTAFASSAGAFSLTSTAFISDSTIPKQYSCDGKDISPQLSWTDSPDKTQSFAFILSDPDAPGGTFYHWILYDLPKNTTNLSEGISQLPANAQTGKNSWNNIAYRGPCPPKGATHHYIFTLYALDTMLHLDSGASADMLLVAMQNHILGQAELRATFQH